MKGQISVYIIIGIILLSIVLIFASYATLILLGVIPDPFLASDVTSYMSTCLDQSLTCSLVEHGLKIDLNSDSEEKQKKYAVEDYPICAQNISSAFAGKKILLKELNTDNTKVLFSRNDTTITLESPAKVEIGKSTKIIGSLASRIPVAFSSMIQHARELKTELQPGDHQIVMLPENYQIEYYQTNAPQDIVVLSDENSLIGYKRPYVMVFEELK